jgi:hypothetical protein
MPKAPKPEVRRGRRSELMNDDQATKADEMEDHFFAYAASLSPNMSAKDRKRCLTQELTRLATNLLETPLFKGSIEDGNPKRNKPKWMNVRYTPVDKPYYH